MMFEGMGPRDTRIWAKEMTVEAIDQYWATVGLPDDFDERQAVLRERDRVAKFLGVAAVCPSPFKKSEAD
jgi:hypothetical protein